MRKIEQIQHFSAIGDDARGVVQDQINTFAKQHRIKIKHLAWSVTPDSDQSPLRVEASIVYRRQK